MNLPRKTPCYAVIFTSTLSDSQEGYDAMSDRMLELAAQQPGYLGIESFRSPDGKGVTISYWEDLNAITAWKQNPEHQSAQELGKTQWYQNYSIEIARIESGYSFDRL
ncbi:antibiotic biosynthesis monooxygenase family protein [Gimesia maris]|uniref:antibiotic biosynthesis monooxygenase family protein n=1 Tax=Gimesia maris TaxID=122 RepID=UPI000E9B1B43|nr:antibiotic biosynthesis monooxygenase [Gimesia maris]HAW26549.1 antibiotic biosynthesis monooxygenase [Planctomycetaceae bacterium]|tara:strand:+ start:926 stop:1249 length:324 start_codon:yes stop_codon:yes gene_type:complete